MQKEIGKTSSQSIKRQKQIEEESVALSNMDLRAVQASRESASQMKQAEIQKRRGTQMKEHQTPVTAQRAVVREEKKAASAKVPKYDANTDNSA